MRKIHHLLLILVLTLFAGEALAAQNIPFGRYFEDRTLRLDYILSGNVSHQSISLYQLSSSPHWYGKRYRLSEIPVQGNGQLVVKDKLSGGIIYKQSFSTLFQEWLTYDEAKQTQRAFEYVMLMPLPISPVDVTFSLYDNKGQVTATFTHSVDPKDILIRQMGQQELTPAEILLSPQSPTNSIKIAFVAEGYTKDEMPVFKKDVQNALSALFAHEPFSHCKDRFQILAVMPNSIQSGTSIPARHEWKNTPLHAHYDTFYSSRYLTTLNLFALHDLLAGLPYEHIIILVNTDNYGGGGILNSYNLAAAHHPSFRSVVVHEFGHSFAGLADEYAYEQEAIPMYPKEIEPWEKNITTLKDFDSKWKSLLSPKCQIPTPEDSKNTDKIGVYEGAGYSLKGVYRAYPNCRMRTNEYPVFCKVCQLALQEVIDFYTIPIGVKTIVKKHK